MLQGNNEERSQICSLKESGKEGTCLGQLTLPSSWWPSFTPKDLIKQPKIRINVKYSVFESPMGCEESKIFFLIFRDGCKKAFHMQSAYVREAIRKVLRFRHFAVV